MNVWNISYVSNSKLIISVISKQQTIKCQLKVSSSADRKQMVYAFAANIARGRAQLRHTRWRCTLHTHFFSL
jgi:hypothetical protein